MKINKRITRGDCYELLNQLEEKIIDLIVTDPPYLSSTTPRTVKNAKLYDFDEYIKICSGYNIELFLALCERVCRKMNCFIFCSNNQIPTIMQWALDRKYYATLLTWNKTNAIPFCYNSWKPDIEFIIHIREKGAFFNGDPKICSKLYSSITTPSKYGHPTEKPIDLLSKLIQVGSEKGDLILDPFAGSGTTIVAGLKLKRQALGFEIKEEYCKMAEKRIKDFLFQGDLFL